MNITFDKPNWSVNIQLTTDVEKHLIQWVVKRYTISVLKEHIVSFFNARQIEMKQESKELLYSHKDDADVAALIVAKGLDIW